VARCAGMAWISTNVMFGIENQCLDLNRAFSAGAFALNDSWGDAPGFR
jgi:hypothetical protein